MRLPRGRNKKIKEAIETAKQAMLVLSKAKGNVLYVLSGDTFEETVAKPWVETSSWSSKAKEAFEAMAAVEDPRRYLLFADGRSKEFRRQFDDLTESNEKCLYVEELWIVYKPSARTGRRISFNSANREACLLVLPCAKTKIPAKSREGAEGNAAGEATTHSSTYIGVAPLPWRAQPMISQATKQSIFGREPPTPLKTMFDVSMGEPLFWRDWKTQVLWKRIITDTEACAVYDLSPGSGLLAKQCLSIGIPYVGLCHQEKQVPFLQNAFGPCGR